MRKLVFKLIWGQKVVCAYLKNHFSNGLEDIFAFYDVLEGPKAAISSAVEDTTYLSR